MITIKKLVHSELPEVTRVKAALATLKDLETRPITSQAEAVQALRELAIETRAALVNFGKLTIRALNNLEE